MNISIKLTLVAILLSFSIGLIAQDSGDQMFDNSVMHEVNIEFDQSDYWQVLTQNYETAPIGNVPYLMGKVTIDGEFVDSVGVRFKGFTSYTEDNKKPIKIDFNEYVPGKRFDGLRKLNLNNATADPSMQRDVICYDLLRSMEVPAPRTSYSKVYFNGEFWGVYQSIEQIDQEFLQNHFENDKGNLFKNLGWSHLEWLGNQEFEYQEAFHLKTNKEGNDWSGFVNFVDVLNNSTDNNFKDEIEEVFNVDMFLKTLAVDVATDNWDSYLEHGRNWYMYEDTTTGIFNWIPWDYNLSLGGDFSGGGPGDECFISPYISTLLVGTETVQFYDVSWPLDGGFTYLWEFGDENSSTEQNPLHTYDAAGTYEVCLTISSSPTCTEQTCIFINTSTNYNDCESIIDGTCPHPVGENFANTLEWIPSCCEIWGDQCEEIYGIFSGEGGGGGFPIDQRENTGVLIKRLLNEPEFYDRYLGYFCDLSNNFYTEDKMNNLIDNNKNLIEGDVQSEPYSLYTFQEFLDDVGDEGIKNRIAQRTAGLLEEIATLTTCSSPYIAVDLGDITINEFVASNDSTSMIADEEGEYDDWVELYNNTPNSIDLSGVYLSDAIGDFQKWQFEEGTTIPGNGYFIVWTDKDDEQGPNHTNFKLNAAGDELYLSNFDGSIIDSISFGEQITNVAAARIPNGTGNFVSQDETFGYNNEFMSSVDQVTETMVFDLNPNPTRNQFEIELTNDNRSQFLLKIFSMDGRLVESDSFDTDRYSVYTNDWSNGVYIVQLMNEDGISLRKKLIVSH